MFCPRCGARNDDVNSCVQCGLDLKPAAALGADAVAPSVPAPAPAMPGSNIQTPAPAPAVRVPNRNRPLQGTMMGVAMPPGTPGAPGSPAAPQARQVPKGTMMGVAFPAMGNIVPGAPPPSAPISVPQPVSAPMPPSARTSELPVKSPRQVLVELFAQHGTHLFEDANQTNAHLYNEFSRDVNLLMMALQDHVPQMLMNASGETPVEMLLRGFTRRMVETRGVSEEQARYAIESWALALGLLSR